MAFCPFINQFAIAKWERGEGDDTRAHINTVNISATFVTVTFIDKYMHALSLHSTV